MKIMLKCLVIVVLLSSCIGKFECMKKRYSKGYHLFDIKKNRSSYPSNSEAKISLVKNLPPGLRSAEKNVISAEQKSIKKTETFLVDPSPQLSQYSTSQDQINRNESRHGPIVCSDKNLFLGNLLLKRNKGTQKNNISSRTMPEINLQTIGLAFLAAFILVIIFYAIALLFGFTAAIFFISLVFIIVALVTLFNSF